MMKITVQMNVLSQHHFDVDEIDISCWDYTFCCNVIHGTNECKSSVHWLINNVNYSTNICVISTSFWCSQHHFSVQEHRNDVEITHSFVM